MYLPRPLLAVFTAIPLLALAAPTEPHPMNLEPLLPWISDDVGPVSMIRVLPAEAFRESHERDYSPPTRSVYHRASRVDDRGYFGYERIGDTDSGIRVFLTFDSGGGSGTFQYSLFLRPVTVAYARLDLSKIKTGNVTLSPRPEEGFALVTSEFCGDRTLVEMHIEGDVVQTKMADPRSPVPKERPEEAVSSEMHDFSETSSR